MDVVKASLKRRWYVCSEEFTTKKKAEEHLKNCLVGSSGTPTEPGIYLIETEKGLTIAKLENGVLETCRDEVTTETFRYWRIADV